MDRWTCPECGETVHTAPWWNATAHELDVHSLRVICDGQLYCAGVGKGHVPRAMVAAEGRAA
jgi:hypothetical protein